MFGFFSSHSHSFIRFLWSQLFPAVFIDQIDKELSMLIHEGINTHWYKGRYLVFFRTSLIMQPKFSFLNFWGGFLSAHVQTLVSMECRG